MFCKFIGGETTHHRCLVAMATIMITTDTTSGITHIGRDELQPSKGKQEIRNNVIYGIVIYDNYLME